MKWFQGFSWQWRVTVTSTLSFCLVQKPKPKLCLHFSTLSCMQSEILEPSKLNTAYGLFKEHINFKCVDIQVYHLYRYIFIWSNKIRLLQGDQRVKCWIWWQILYRIKKSKTLRIPQTARVISAPTILHYFHILWYLYLTRLETSLYRGTLGQNSSSGTFTAVTDWITIKAFPWR